MSGPMPGTSDSAVAEALDGMPGPDEGSAASIHARAARILRPPGALARLDEAAAWLAAWQRTDHPAVAAPALVLFAADHGVVARGVTPYPSEVTAAVVKAVESGVATAPVMAALVGATVRVVDVGVAVPTGDISREPAMSEERFLDAFDAGRRAVRELGTDLLILGEMGIGNTTAAAAVSTALFGLPAARWTGRGTGIDDEMLAAKVAVVEAAVARLSASAGPIEILRQLGGAELAALAGAVTEARLRSIPCVLDGFVVGAAVAPLHVLRPGALDHCVAGHRSSEAGHGRLLHRLGLDPLLDLGMRLGEGSGALSAVPLLRLAAACVTDVATFDELGLERL